ncbi:MAG: ABC transporter permease [Acidobacteriaceae bacterium]|nr:ABC transporter permease [Acidobacteriaceae bacterium]
MTNLWLDLRYALRGIARNPVFAAIAILSLALGIGANTAIFTIMDQLMLRNLPVKNPGQLVMLYQRGAHNGSNMGDRMNSYPIYQDFQKKAAPLSEVVCRRLVSASVNVQDHTERVQAELVSGNYFTMLGVQPAIGRVFNSETDDRTYMGHPVVVLAYDYWVNRFNRDPTVVGKKILVNNYPLTVVGVSAANFVGLDPARAPQIRVPILMEPLIVPEWFWFKMDDRRTRWVQMFGRLKPGYTISSAQASLQVLFHQIREYETTLPAAKDWSKFQRQQFLSGTIQLQKAAEGYSQLRNSFSTALIVLMCMVGLVLLIACANVANLLIARAFARQREIAVRISIGASRPQLLRQLLVESLVLSVVGGTLGICLAILMTKGLLALMPAEGNALLIRPTPDARILLFTIGLTVLTSLIFGLLPGIRAGQFELWNVLKDAAGSIAAPGGSLYLRKGLVAFQVALSFLLLFGAGLFVKSLQNLKATPTGFRDPDNLITFQVSPALNGYDATRTVHFYDEVLENIRAIPGVKAAALAAEPLLSGDEWDSTTSVEGHQAKDGEDMQAFMNALSPGYFQTMGIPIIAGRDFDRRDIKDKSTVAIVNEHFARHFFGNGSALGRHIGRGAGPGTKFNIEIVGVVGDSLFEGPREGVHRQVFIPNWGNNSAAFYVRGALASNLLYTAVKQQLKKLDATMPIYEMKTLGKQLDETLLTERLVALLSAGFGLLATLLGAIGLYGVMAFVVARRTKEVGLRMALGANRGSVIWLVMQEVLVLLLIGLAVGVPAALGLARFIAAQLYGIKPADPWTAAISLLALIVVATAAGLVPAGRASRIDPILALRYE